MAGARTCEWCCVGSSLNVTEQAVHLVVNLIDRLSVVLFADGIVKYMKSKAGPSSKELLTADDADKFFAVNEHSIVGW